MEALKEADVLSDGVLTTNYSDLGSELNHPYYGNGTLGRAKADCDIKADAINGLLADINGKVQIVVATAVTTKASSVIPFFPVYCVGLYKVMTEKGTHETRIMHMGTVFTGIWSMVKMLKTTKKDVWDQIAGNSTATPRRRRRYLIEELNEENFNTDKTAYDLFYKEFSNLSGFMVDNYEDQDVTIEELKALDY